MWWTRAVSQPLPGCCPASSPSRELEPTSVPSVSSLATTASSYSLRELRRNRNRKTPMAWVQWGTERAVSSLTVCAAPLSTLLEPASCQVSTMALNRWEGLGGYSNSAMEIFWGVFPLAKEWGNSAKGVCGRPGLVSTESWHCLGEWRQMLLCFQNEVMDNLVWFSFYFWRRGFTPLCWGETYCLVRRAQNWGRAATQSFCHHLWGCVALSDLWNIC